MKNTMTQRYRLSQGRFQSLALLPSGERQQRSDPSVPRAQGLVKPISRGGLGRSWRDLSVPRCERRQRRRAPLGEPEAFPVACYAPDADRRDVRWVDLGTGRPVKVWWEREVDIFDDGLEVSTFAGIAYAHRRFIEARYLDARGQPHEQFVAGELQRRRVHITRVVCLGKESSHLSEVQSGLMDANENYTIYDRVPGPDCDSQLQAAVREIPLSWLVKTTGMSGRAIQYVRNGHVTPRPPQRAKLWAAVDRWKHFIGRSHTTMTVARSTSGGQTNDTR